MLIPEATLMFAASSKFRLKRLEMCEWAMLGNNEKLTKT